MEFCVQTSPVWTITKEVAPPSPVRLEGLGGGGGQVQVAPGLVLGVAQVQRLAGCKLCFPWCW